MFDKEFYPTPRSLVSKIITKLNGRKYGRVLDPSAGKGDLLFPIASRFNAKPYAIERNMELCSILREHNATVLGHDWMQYAGEHSFDLVVMNPPFSKAEDHFLHAMNLYPDADIVCIIPGKENDYLNSKKGGVIKNMLGDFFEFEEHDGAFAAQDAERKTNVSVLVCYVLRQKTEKKDEGFFGFEAEKEEEVEFNLVDQQSGLVKRDVIAQLVRNYQEAVSEFKTMVESRHRLMQICGAVVKKGYTLDDMIKRSFEKGPKPADMYNGFVEELKESSWNSVFTEGKFATFMTDKVRKEFAEFIKINGQLSFSEENIHNILLSLYQNSRVILSQNVENVFDLLTKYHDGNRCHVEGWKTNDKWKVKKKFILPYVAERWYGGTQWHINYNTSQKLHDIDVAMCSLTGNNIEKIVTIEKAIATMETSDDFAESEFFKIKCYNKGTGHFTFKDEDLWNIFNLEACGMKKWLAE